MAPTCSLFCDIRFISHLHSHWLKYIIAHHHLYSACILFHLRLKLENIIQACSGFIRGEFNLICSNQFMLPDIVELDAGPQIIVNDKLPARNSKYHYIIFAITLCLDLQRLSWVHPLTALHTLNESSKWMQILYANLASC